MKAQDLQNINIETRKMILEFMEKKTMTLNAFAIRSGVHQNQLWLYLYTNNEKGLHSKTLEKIGKFLTENK
jgi:hypothetical protein